MTEQAAIKDAIVSTESGLSLCPADISLAKGETEIMSKVGNTYLLKECLEPVQVNYRHILIDCPPSLGLLTLNALAAADAVLIPVQCQFFALKGLAALVKTVQSVQKRLNPKLKVLGALPTIAELNTIMTQDVIASMQKRLQGARVFDPVPKSVKFAESNLAGEPIHIYARKDKQLSEPYQKIANELNGGEA